MPLSEQTQLAGIKEKRILKEIKEIQSTPIDEDNNIYESSPGCYVFINDENITNHKIMIIGPEDTPYENGFYMFDYTYHKNHPFEAPSVKFLTTDGTVRFNPNLYSNGKVCLSILGTWSGPAWEPTMSLRVVCEYLRSILNENPIQNEPGFENCKDTQSKNYIKYVTSENYYISIYSNLTNLSYSLKPFCRVLDLKFVENYSKIRNKLKTLNNIDKYLGHKISPYSKELRFSIKNSKQFLEDYFLQLHNDITNKESKKKYLFNKILIQTVYNENF
jgi:ubiquitin-protein ligase